MSFPCQGAVDSAQDGEHTLIIYLIFIFEASIHIYRIKSVQEFDEVIESVK